MSHAITWLAWDRSASSFNLLSGGDPVHVLPNRVPECSDTPSLLAHRYILTRSAVRTR